MSCMAFSLKDIYCISERQEHHSSKSEGTSQQERTLPMPPSSDIQEQQVFHMPLHSCETLTHLQETWLFFVEEVPSGILLATVIGFLLKLPRLSKYWIFIQEDGEHFSEDSGDHQLGST